MSSPLEVLRSRPSLLIPCQSLISNTSKRLSKKKTSYLPSKNLASLNTLLPPQDIPSQKSLRKSNRLSPTIPFLRKSFQAKQKDLFQTSQEKIPQYMISPFPVNKILNEPRHSKRNHSFSPKNVEVTGGMPSSSCLKSPNKKSEGQVSKMAREDIELLLVAMKELSSIAKPLSKLKGDTLNRSLEVQRCTLAETLEFLEEIPLVERPSKVLTQRSEDSEHSPLYPNKPLRYVYRRKSCCCNWCGGVSKFQRETDNNPLVPLIKIRNANKKTSTVTMNKIQLDTWGFLRNSKKLRSSIMQNSSNRRRQDSKARLSVQSQGPNKSTNTDDSERKSHESKEIESNQNEKFDEIVKRKTIEGFRIIENIEMTTSGYIGLKDRRKTKNKKRKNSKIKKKTENVKRKIKSQPKNQPDKKSDKARPLDNKQSSFGPQHITSHRSVPTPADLLFDSTRKDQVQEPKFQTENLITSPESLPTQTYMPSSRVLTSGFRDSKQENRKNLESSNIKNRKLITKSKANEIDIQKKLKENPLKNCLSFFDQENIRLGSPSSQNDIIDQETGFQDNKAQKKLKEFMNELANKKKQDIYKVYMCKNIIRFKSFDLKDLATNKDLRESPAFVEGAAKEENKSNENTEANEERQKAQANRFKMFQKQRRYVNTSPSLKTQENIQKLEGKFQ